MLKNRTKELLEVSNRFEFSTGRKLLFFLFVFFSSLNVFSQVKLSVITDFKSIDLSGIKVFDEQNDLIGITNPDGLSFPECKNGSKIRLFKKDVLDTSLLVKSGYVYFYWKNPTIQLNEFIVNEKHEETSIKESFISYINAAQSRIYRSDTLLSYFFEAKHMTLDSLWKETLEGELLMKQKSWKSDGVNLAFYTNLNYSTSNQKREQKIGKLIRTNPVTQLLVNNIGVRNPNPELFLKGSKKIEMIKHDSLIEFSVIFENGRKSNNFHYVFRPDSSYLSMTRKHYHSKKGILSQLEVNFTGSVISELSYFKEIGGMKNMLYFNLNVEIKPTKKNSSVHLNSLNAGTTFREIYEKYSSK